MSRSCATSKFRILRRRLPQRRTDGRRDPRGDEAFSPTFIYIGLPARRSDIQKADCLNWIYQRMLLFEEERGIRFDMILTHDAEDLMDPDALRWINYYAQWNEMVQIPVLALPTPVFDLAHGVYCDEFAEYQFKDMPARQLLGGFIPLNGVGTGFSREALEGLARAHSNKIFEPACLTEDYENGWRIHHMGMRQKFIPVQIRHGRAIATREYFPLTFRTAIRQRSRWVTGIGLQLLGVSFHARHAQPALLVLAGSQVSHWEFREPADECSLCCRGGYLGPGHDESPAVDARPGTETILAIRN